MAKKKKKKKVQLPSTWTEGELSSVGERSRNQGIGSKVNKTLGFLRWNQKISTTQLKETAYMRPFVCPILEYACSVWNPHTKQNIDRIEAVKETNSNDDLVSTTTITLLLYSVQEIINNLEQPSLQYRMKSCQNLHAVQNSAWHIDSVTIDGS